MKWEIGTNVIFWDQHFLENCIFVTILRIAKYGINNLSKISLRNNFWSYILEAEKKIIDLWSRGSMTQFFNWDQPIEQNYRDKTKERRKKKKEIRNIERKKQFKGMIEKEILNRIVILENDRTRKIK